MIAERTLVARAVEAAHRHLPTRRTRARIGLAPGEREGCYIYSVAGREGAFHRSGPNPGAGAASSSAR